MKRDSVPRVRLSGVHEERVTEVHDAGRPGGEDDLSVLRGRHRVAAGGEPFAAGLPGIGEQPRHRPVHEPGGPTPRSPSGPHQTRAGVELSSLDQPLFDGAGVTKGELVDHLDGFAARMLAALGHRRSPRTSSPRAARSPSPDGRDARG